MMTTKITKSNWKVIDGDTHLSKWVEETGQIDHGQRLQEQWKDYLNYGGIALDVGANIGTTTVPMARLVGPKGRIHAFEPNPAAFECLQHNVKQAGVDGWVTCYNVGAGETKGMVPFRLNENVGASYVVPKGSKEIPTGSIYVQPLDFLELEKCDFVKMDVEGYEIFALRGMSKLLKKCRPAIQLEVSVHSARHGFDQLAMVAEMAIRGYLPHSTSIKEIVEAAQIDVVFERIFGLDNLLEKTT